jgi:hypothetical protein
MGWEDTFTTWSQPPGKTEQEKCDNAVTAVRRAIAAHSTLSQMEVEVSPQGSYRARTNVRQDSDVDICVCLKSVVFCDYPPEKSNSDYGMKDSDIEFGTYKNWVQEALEEWFGAGSIKRGKKAFDVHENTYRVDADVLPAWQYRRYWGSDWQQYHRGIAFLTDAGVRIENWPQQNYDSGVAKNEATGRRYKALIRILKNLRNKMQEDKIAAAKDVASFLIECLVWNVPNDDFGQDTLTGDVRNVLAHTFNQTLKFETCKEWGEVNELKYLFRLGQPWTLAQAHAFLDAAWDYVGFK